VAEFDEWNKDDVLPLNNCYNYATGNRNEPPKNKGDKVPQPATPGKKASEKKDSKIKPVGAGPDEQQIVEVGPDKTQIVLLKIKCDRLKEAILGDGLGELKNDKCDANCWKVHYYVQEPGGGKKGDYHFVREGPGAGFSHKPNRGGEPVTRKRWNEGSSKYDGKPIDDPTDGKQVGPGYKWCGVVCCCPDTKVAMAEPPKGALVAVAYGDAYGQGPTFRPEIKPDAVVELVASLPERLHANWTDGWGSGDALYRIDLRAPAERAPHKRGPHVQTVFVRQGSISFWDGAIARQIADPENAAHEAFRTLLGAPDSIAIEDGAQNGGAA
jgi:hypothetical protein